MASEIYSIDQKTLATLESLKPIYGVGTWTHVLKRALALAVVMNKYADKDGNIHVVRNGRVAIIIEQRVKSG